MLSKCIWRAATSIIQPVCSLSWLKKDKQRFPCENLKLILFFFLNQIKSHTSQYGSGMSREGGSVPWKDLLIQNDNDAYVAKPLAWFAHKRPNTSTQRHPNTNQHEEGGKLTISGLSRAKMAKVDSLSHTHLVRNELTDTALQLRVDQEPSSEELGREKDAVNGNGGKAQ